MGVHLVLSSLSVESVQLTEPTVNGIRQKLLKQLQPVVLQISGVVDENNHESSVFSMVSVMVEIESV